MTERPAPREPEEGAAAATDSARPETDSGAARRGASSTIRPIVGLAVSAGAIFLSVRGVAWSDVRVELADAHYLWLVPAALLIVAGQWLRGLRWRALFGRAPRPSRMDAVLILSVGYLVSAVLPFRLGDPARAWLAANRTDADAAEAFAAVLAERVQDLFTIVIMLALWLPDLGARLLTFQLGPGPWDRPALIRWGTLALVAVAYAAAFAISRSAPGVARMLGGGPPARMIGRFVGGFRPLSQAGSGLWSGALSIAIWMLGAAGYWTVMQAFDLRLGLSVAVFAMCATAVLAIIPSSPGYVGVFHYGVQTSLALAAGVPKHVALSYAVVLHALTIGVLVVLGVAALWMLGASWTGVTSGARASMPEASPDRANPL